MTYDIEYYNPQRFIDMEEHLKAFLEVEAAIADSIHLCFSHIREGYVINDDRSGEELIEFESAFFERKVELIQLYHQRELDTYGPLVTYPNHQFGFRALHAEEFALIRDFHNIHQMIYEGCSLLPEDLEELDDMLERNLPWKTAEDQKRLIENTFNKGEEIDLRKICRSSDECLHNTLKIINLRVFLQTKLAELEARLPKMDDLEESQQNPMFQSSPNKIQKLRDLQKSCEMLITKHTLENPKLEHPAYHIAVLQQKPPCPDRDCRTQRQLQEQALFKRGQEITTLVKASVKDGEKIHRLQETLIAMQVELDAHLVESPSIEPSSPQHLSQIRNLEHDAIQRLRQEYGTDDEPSEARNRQHFSMYTSMKISVEKDKALLKQSKQAQEKQLRAFELAVEKFEGQKRLLDEKAKKLKQDEERLRNYESIKAKAKEHKEKFKQSDKNAPRYPKIQNGAGPSSNPTVRSNRLASQSKRRSFLPRPVRKAPLPPILLEGESEGEASPLRVKSPGWIADDFDDSEDFETKDVPQQSYRPTARTQALAAAEPGYETSKTSVAPRYAPKQNHRNFNAFPPPPNQLGEPFREDSPGFSRVSARANAQQNLLHEEPLAEMSTRTGFGRVEGHAKARQIPHYNGTHTEISNRTGFARVEDRANIEQNPLFQSFNIEIPQTRAFARPNPPHQGSLAEMSDNGGDNSKVQQSKGRPVPELQIVNSPSHQINLPFGNINVYANPQAADSSTAQNNQESVAMNSAPRPGANGGNALHMQQVGGQLASAEFVDSGLGDSGEVSGEGSKSHHGIWSKFGVKLKKGKKQNGGENA